MAIAWARDEDEVVRYAEIAMWITLAVGAYGELGDDEEIPRPTTIVVRVRREGQGKEIVGRFPGVSVPSTRYTFRHR